LVISASSYHAQPVNLIHKSSTPSPFAVNVGHVVTRGTAAFCGILPQPTERCAEAGTASRRALPGIA
jgi:hypothetical protein